MEDNFEEDPTVGNSNANYKDKEKCDERLLQLRLRLEAKYSEEVENTADMLKSELRKASEAARLQIQERTSYCVFFLDDIIKEIDAAEKFEDVETRLQEKWHNVIGEWKSDVWAISKDLSVRCTQSLIAYKKRLVNTKLYATDVINLFIENLTSEINKILICNERDYLETESQLRKVYGVYVTMWHKKQTYLIIQAIKCSKEKDSEIFEECVELTPGEQVEKYLADLLNEFSKPSEVPLPETLMISHLIVYLSHLELCKEHIEHFHELAINIVKEKIVGCTVGATDFGLKKVEELWVDVIGSMKAQVDEAYKYLTESIQNWNYFVMKLQKAECISSRVLHRYRKNCSKFILNFEERLNILFDKLRESNDLLDLRINCEQICNAFQNIEETRRSMRNNEDKILNQSITMFFTVYDLLTTDMSVTDQEMNETVFQIALPSQDIDELEAVQLCLANAKNWLYGFQETVKFLQREVLKFLREFLGSWLAYKKGESEFFLKLDIERINQRKSRTAQNILEVRWAELLDHSKAFETFVKGIDVEFRLLGDNAASLKDELKDLEDELASVLANYAEQQSEGPLSVLYLNHIGKRWREKYRVKKANKVRKYKEEAARVCQWLKHLSITFLRSVKLFGEGGNYSLEEADELVSKINSVQKKIKKHRLKINSKLDFFASRTLQTITGHQERQLTMKELLALAQLQTHHVINLKLNELQKRLDREISNGRGVISILNQLAKSTEKGKNCETLESIARIVGNSCYYFGLPEFRLQIDVERIINNRSSSLEGNRAKIHGCRRMTDFLTLGFLTKDYESPLRESSSTSKEITTAPKRSLQCKRLKEWNSKNHDRNTVNHTKRRFKHRLSKQSNGLARTDDKEKDEPVEGCGYNFLYAMKKVILEAFVDIKHTIERTYLVTYGIPEEFTETLTEEYLRKMRKINLLGEISWNALLIEFISSLLNIVQLLPECADVELDRAFKMWNTKKKMRMDELENTIDSFNIEKEKKKVDAELKPWHGYPLNKSILQKLLRKVYNTCHDQLTRRKDVLDKFQNEITDFWQEQKESKAILVQRTNEINEVIFVNPDVRRFVSTLYSYTSRFNRFNETKRKGNGNTVYLKCVEEYLHWANSEESATQTPDIEIEKISLEELEQISVNIVQFLKNLKAIHIALHELIQTGYFPPPEFVTDSSNLEHEDEFVSKFFKEFQEKIEFSHKQLKSEIEQSLQECKREFDDANENLLRWKDEWICHVKNVIRLYSVDPILEAPPSSIKRLANKITPRNAVPYHTEPIQ